MEKRSKTSIGINAQHVENSRKPSDFATKIEITRRAILRIIGFWLFALRLLVRGKEVHLPHRVDALVCQMIFKLEKAVALLLFAHAYQPGVSMANEAERRRAYDRVIANLILPCDLSIGELIARLEALKCKLKALPPIALTKCLIGSSLARFHAPLLSTLNAVVRAPRRIFLPP